MDHINEDNIIYISSGEEDESVENLSQGIRNAHDETTRTPNFEAYEHDKRFDDGPPVKRQRLDSLFSRRYSFNPPEIAVERTRSVDEKTRINDNGNDDSTSAHSISNESVEVIDLSDEGIDIMNNSDTIPIDGAGPYMLRAKDKERLISGDEEEESGFFDDDLMIIDTDEALRSAKFKETSFSNNKEALSVDEIRNRQGREKMSNYLMEHKKLNISLNEASFEHKKSLSSLEAISKSVMKLSEQEKLYKARNDSTSLEMWKSITSILETKRSQLFEARKLFHEAKLRFDSLVSKSRLIQDGIRGLKSTLGSSFSELVSHEGVFVSRDNANPFRGYASNIYSQRSDDVDLKDLLDNIRPDEELEGGLELTPVELSVNLMKHQRMGLSWLLRMETSKSMGGILADDMGLGKTIQAIALIMANKPKDDIRSTLIVTPVSLLRQWGAEIESKLKRSANVRVLLFHGSDKRFISSHRRLRGYDIILTSYGTLSSEWKKHFGEELRRLSENGDSRLLPNLSAGGRSYTSPFFSRDANFFRVILDEAQNIKNKASIASKAVACLKSIFRLCLSGTPMQNNVEELYPLLRFLQIKPYNDERKFKSDIIMPLKSSNYDDYDKKSSLRKLRALLKAISLRRSKDSVIDGKPILQLPEKHVTEVSVTMGKKEKDYYTSLEAGIQSQARSLLSNRDSQKGVASNILSLLLRLRQACLHSYLVEIGLMKSDLRSANNAQDCRKMSQKVFSMDPSVRASVRSRLFDKSDDSGMFSCPMCYEISAYTSVQIMSSCGHTICSKCVDDLFSENKTEEEEIAISCHQCSKMVRQVDLIDYDTFQMIVVDKLSDSELEQRFNASSAFVRKEGTNSIIESLVLRNGGDFPMSAKLDKCFSLLNDIFENHPDEKVVIFSQFTTLFDVMRLVFKKNGIRFLRYDGSMSIEAKNDTIREFYQGLEKVLLLSLRSGNVGLTLTCASQVIIMDPFWNPFVEEQAMDRTHRIGQEREVYVHRILIDGTVESRIMELQRSKKELVGNAFDEQSMKSVSKLGQRELGFLFGLNELH